MPKTSASQFEMLVDYMERNGDLSKPTTTGPSGRLNTINRWEDLTNILNADATGDTKNTDKWRKVWSDLKNNTKRKKARILQSANGTGGGPASKIQLSVLEDRVLNIIGPQAATGIPEVPEIGLTQEIIPAGPTQFLPPSPPAAQETSESYLEDLHQSPVVGSLQEPAGSPQTPTSRRIIRPRVRLVPTEDLQTSPVQQRRSLQTESGRERRRFTPRRRRLYQEHETSPVPRRRARLQTQSERARQEFLQSDREWRAFYMNREQEANRLREMELAQQARWQDLFATLLVTCNAAIDIFKNRNT